MEQYNDLYLPISPYVSLYLAPHEGGGGRLARRLVIVRVRVRVRIRLRLRVTVTVRVGCSGER